MKKLFKQIGKKIGIVEENKTEEIMEKRSEIKVTMAQNLKNIGFTDSEVKEVLDILEKSEKDVQEQKDLLIGTNINNDYTDIVMKQIFDEIRGIEIKAAADIRSKIAEIRSRKSKQ